MPSPQHCAQLHDLADALRRAHQLWQSAQPGPAEALCRSVLGLWPGQPDALHLLGLMAHARRQPESALDFMRQACRSPRAAAVIFRNLTEMCRQQGLFDEAERAGRQAVALEPNHADGWSNLGIALQDAGKLGESRVCLSRALELKPDDAKCLDDLGTICRLAGDFSAAEGHYRRALGLAPLSARTHANLGALLAARGDPEAGLECAKTALQYAPHDVDAYLRLAEIEALRHRHAQALRWLDLLLAFTPEHVGALNLRTGLLLRSGLGDAALDNARRAVRLAPGDGQAHNALGQALQAQNRADEALDAYRRAAEIPGRQVESALINRAIALQEGGRDDEARAAFDDARQRFPDSPAPLVARVDSKTYAAHDPDIAALEALAAAPERLDVQRQVGIRFALAKAYLDVGDGARAFAHLEIANRLKRATFDYDAEQASDWLARNAAAFPVAVAPVAGAADSPRPVFIVGMPRSGSTLLEQILAAHPQVAAAGELPTLRLAVERAGGDFPDAAPDWPDEAWRRLGGDYLQATEALAAGRRRLIDKMPSNFVYAGAIARALPGARIIDCRRHPVDTCLSCYTKDFLGEQPFCYDLRELGLFYRAYRRLMAHWRSVLPAGQLLEVDYENVVADLEGETRRVLDFLGLAWEPACLEFHRSRRVVRTASATQVRQPVYGHAVGRWRAHAGYLAPLLQALGELAR